MSTNEQLLDGSVYFKRHIFAFSIVGKNVFSKAKSYSISRIQYILALFLVTSLIRFYQGPDLSLATYFDWSRRERIRLEWHD